MIVERGANGHGVLRFAQDDRVSRSRAALLVEHASAGAGNRMKAHTKTTREHSRAPFVRFVPQGGGCSLALTWDAPLTCSNRSTSFPLAKSRH